MWSVWLLGSGVWHSYYLGSSLNGFAHALCLPPRLPPRQSPPHALAAHNTCRPCRDAVTMRCTARRGSRPRPNVRRRCWTSGTLTAVQYPKTYSRVGVTIPQHYSPHRPGSTNETRTKTAASGMQRVTAPARPPQSPLQLRPAPPHSVLPRRPPHLRKRAQLQIHAVDVMTGASSR